LLARLELDPEHLATRQFHRGRGCPACRRTGYQGRLGIFEWLPMNERLRELVMQRAPSTEIQQTAVTCGMQTLRTAGLRAVLDGHTTLEEVAAYT
jgi:type IV pilus assembly protein PilB